MSVLEDFLRGINILLSGLLGLYLVYLELEELVSELCVKLEVISLVDFFASWQFLENTGFAAGQGLQNSAKFFFL